VILILLGAAGSALIAVNSGNRSDFVAVNKDLEPGHRLDRKDLARGDLAGATHGLIPWSQAEKYLGHYTTGWIYQDQFVTAKNFTTDANPPVPSDGALVGITLDPGRAPSDGLLVGDKVSVIRVPTSNQDSVSAQTLVGAAEVTAVSGAISGDKTSTNSTLNVTILVPTTRLTTVAAAAAAKSLVVSKLSPSAPTDVSRFGSK
jgi:hypothetical protein